ncbi:DUF4440 domain-containing protein [Candidatus Colwellia aromaticivorans]|uniref:DUF4440 domain-containing protein n=1 Tax=Candidatus Colwellia aromaticivorans TaxID=2267621 RepID=UPI000DF460BD|nr:DUF4440 domain-containing protein [Candidatus Colwellia aromaticivorans]
MNSQEVIENMESWLSSFSEDTPDNICALYDEKAFLWGTLSQLKLDNTTLIKGYFKNIFKYRNRYVEFNNSTIRLFGDIAVCNGQYTFRWFNDDVKVTTVARFSFVYRKKHGRCFIIDHHSSIIPTSCITNC